MSVFVSFEDIGLIWEKLKLFNFRHEKKCVSNVFYVQPKSNSTYKDIDLLCFLVSFIISSLSSI